MCTAKGQSEEMCRNYIKVLVAKEDQVMMMMIVIVVYNNDDDQVFACGTHAFKPQCSWRNVREIGKVTRLIDGRAKCPYR